MELIHYLGQHFITREQLLERCAIDQAALERLQGLRVMPRPSYRLRLGIACDSFFGHHEEQAEVEYYATSYPGWLNEVAGFETEAQARSVFDQRYVARVGELAAAGIAPANVDLTSDSHLQAEWNAFLDGIYGLCTVSGLPDDVAAKETAIAVIREITAAGATDGAARERLRQAVDLLDQASKPFAPHEVARSSRKRWVDDVRAAWQLR
jgi:hypothetical protein